MYQAARVLAGTLTGIVGGALVILLVREWWISLLHTLAILGALSVWALGTFTAVTAFDERKPDA